MSTYNLNYSIMHCTLQKILSCCVTLSSFIMLSNEYFYIAVVREALSQPVQIDHVVGNTAGNALRAAVHHEGILWDEKCCCALRRDILHFGV